MTDLLVMLAGLSALVEPLIFRTRVSADVGHGPSQCTFLVEMQQFLALTMVSGAVAMAHLMQYELQKYATCAAVYSYINNDA